MTPLEQQQLFLRTFRTGPGLIGSRKPGGRYTQQTVVTEDNALELISTLSSSADIWMSMGEFSPDTSRDAVNVVSLKSFWLDVDAHGKGPYGTPDEALAATKTFVANAALPTPNFVHMTGHGTQVFWVLPEPIAKAEWQPVATDLQELCKRMSLGADPLTADASRILRVPGTYNFRAPDNPIQAVLHEVSPDFINHASFHTAIKAALSKLPPPPKKPVKALCRATFTVRMRDNQDENPVCRDWRRA